MKARSIALLLTAALAVYLVLVGLRGVQFIQSGDPLAIALGAAVLTLPILAAALVIRELRFGQATARLGAKMPDIADVPRRPSGRPVREVADERANALIAQVKDDPSNWMLWFELSVAYDWAGDRTRARQAMRKAIALEKN